MNASAREVGATTDSAAAFKHCRRIARRRARNFYYGLKLLPEPKRSALFAVYAWMRAADDLVDTAGSSGSMSIQQDVQRFRELTDAAFAGHRDGGDPMWIALGETAARFDLDPGLFHAMLDGQIDDLAECHFQSFEQLRQYCYRVASTVGLICIKIWGYEDASARELAIERGIGFQLTNIVRDYKQDFDAGRVYLPHEDFQRHGIDPFTLRNWSRPIACHRMMLEQIERADQHYERSTGLDELISPDCRPTLWAMTTIYRGLLAKMRLNPSRVIMKKRIRLSAIRKASIAMRARWMSRALRPQGQVGRPVSESATA